MEAWEAELRPPRTARKWPCSCALASARCPRPRGRRRSRTSTTSTSREARLRSAQRSSRSDAGDRRCTPLPFESISRKNVVIPSSMSDFARFSKDTWRACMNVSSHSPPAQPDPNPNAREQRPKKEKEASRASLRPDRRGCGARELRCFCFLRRGPGPLRWRAGDHSPRDQKRSARSRGQCGLGDRARDV